MKGSAKMNSVLQDFYNEKIFPSDQSMPCDPKYKKISCQLHEDMESLQKQMSYEQFKKIEDILDLHADLGSMENCQSFSYGFKLGMLLAVEVFT